MKGRGRRVKSDGRKYPISTRAGQHKKPFEKSFEILVCIFNQGGRTQDCLEERVQNGNKARHRDVILQKQRRVMRVKCRTMVEHVLREVCFGSENWSLSQAILDFIKGWETKDCEAFVQIQEERG